MTYLDDGGDGKIFYVTPGYRLIGLNAITGQRLDDFGDDGIIDLKTELDQDIDLVTGEIGLHAAPVAVGNTIVIGAAHLPGGSPPSKVTCAAMTRLQGHESGSFIRSRKAMNTAMTLGKATLGATQEIPVFGVK